VNDLGELLQEFHRDKLAELLRHQAGARHIRQYDLNSPYQYFLNRDDVHLPWVAAAIADLGALVQPASAESWMDKSSSIHTHVVPAPELDAAAAPKRGLVN
jgi:hypothetical protein